jgi:hypothetical protein
VQANDSQSSHVATDTAQPLPAFCRYNGSQSYNLSAPDPGNNHTHVAAAHRWLHPVPKAPLHRYAEAEAAGESGGDWLERPSATRLSVTYHHLRVISIMAPTEFILT